MFVPMRVGLCWSDFANTNTNINTIVKTSTILSVSALHQQSYKSFLVTVNISIAITIETSLCINTGINIGLELV